MKRFNYRLNDQNSQLGSWGKLVPLKYVEVVPGDTVAGAVKSRARSAITKKMIFSRAYYDLYAFYVPYRLLWRDWVNFISGSPKASPDTQDPIPNLTVERPWNFEDLRGTATLADCNNFLGDAYSLIHNRFFATIDGDASNQQSTNIYGSQSQGGASNVIYGRWNGSSMLDVYRRPTTFDAQLRSSADTPDTTIDVSGPTVTVAEIREAFSEDRWQKLRDFYGHRYTDYLAAVGVKASWSMLDEPECIGASNNDWVFKTTRGTSEGAIAETKGYFDGEVGLKLRKTFCPEHGLIAIMAAPRADLFNVGMGCHVAAARKTRDEFFSPQFMNNPNQPVKNVISGAVAGQELTAPSWQEFRVGRNEIGDRTIDVMQVFNSPVSSITDETVLYTQPSPNDFEPEPATPVEGQPYGTEIPIFTETRLTRLSPVTPMATTGVA